VTNYVFQEYRDLYYVQLQSHKTTCVNIDIKLRIGVMFYEKLI